MKCAKRTSRCRRLLITLMAAAAMQGLPSLATAQGNPNPRIAPPNSSPYGLSYGEWGAEWWKWALGVPLAENPFRDRDDFQKFQAALEAGPTNDRR